MIPNIASRTRRENNREEQNEVTEEKVDETVVVIENRHKSGVPRTVGTNGFVANRDMVKDIKPENREELLVVDLKGYHHRGLEDQRNEREVSNKKMENRNDDNHRARKKTESQIKSVEVPVMSSDSEPESIIIGEISPSSSSSSDEDDEGHAVKEGVRAQYLLDPLTDDDTSDSDALLWPHEDDSTVVVSNVSPECKKSAARRMKEIKQYQHEPTKGK